jgi:hypothetical protein
VSAESNLPLRTCVGCRKRSAKKGLVRLVLIGSQLKVDKEAKQDGRGAYVHQTQECFEAAMNYSAFDRSFRKKVDVSDVQSFFRP